MFDTSTLEEQIGATQTEIAFWQGVLRYLRRARESLTDSERTALTAERFRRFPTQDFEIDPETKRPVQRASP